MKTQKQRTENGNVSLRAFPADVIDRLQPESKRYDSYDVLSKETEEFKWAYFPDRGTVVSMTRTSLGGVTVEVGIVRI